MRAEEAAGREIAVAAEEKVMCRKSLGRVHWVAAETEGRADEVEVWGGKSDGVSLGQSSTTVGSGSRKGLLVDLGDVVSRGAPSYMALRFLAGKGDKKDMCM